MTSSITQIVYTHNLNDAGNEEAGRLLGEAIEKEVLKAENSITVSLPKQEEASDRRCQKPFDCFMMNGCGGVDLNHQALGYECGWQRCINRLRGVIGVARTPFGV